MACSIDHSTLAGVSFCTECGASVTPSKKYCSQGHESPASKKFCETCGESFSASAAPVPSGMAPPPPPPGALNSTQSEHIAYDPFAYVPPKKNNFLIPIIAGASALALLVVGLLVYNVTKVEYTNIPVTMTLYDEDCWDLGWGYFDIPGGEIIMTVDGVETAYASYPSYGSDGLFGCEFSTTFYDVPMNGEYYELTMASGRRGSVEWSNLDMVDNEWSISVNMGF